jgi:hypothetical protein
MPSFEGENLLDAASQTAAVRTERYHFMTRRSRILGLKRVKEKRPEQAVELDHIDEQPTPN